MRSFRGLLLAFVTVSFTPRMLASEWTPPTPAELQMTADPAAPGAPAVYLYREELTDDKLHVLSLYVRIKVLTEKGKSYGDVKIHFDSRPFSVTDVAARTIHADGTIIPLTGKPLENLLMRQGEERFKSTVFSLPAVEPGSILEYRYKLRYDNNIFVQPVWYIQQPVFLHKAHYRFVPSDQIFTSTTVCSTGSRIVVGDLPYWTWAGNLPQRTAVKTVAQAQGNPAYELDVQDVPPLPDESYMPPIARTSYRLIFYPVSTRTPEEYWQREGKCWSKEVDRFANPSPAMHAAVDSLTAAADTPEQKLRKLYAAIMALENTSFTREHSAAENKAEGLKVKTADDIWAQKRGNSEELNRLFLALARAAGFKAYDMAVVNRDRDVLLTGYMDWRQLDDEIAIVQLDGKDTFDDPGQRYAECGKLHWKHAAVEGIRQVEGGQTTVAQSAAIGYKDSILSRTADIQLDEHGQLSGMIRVAMSGAPALYWRQQALAMDEQELHQQYDKSIRNELPGGVEVKLQHMIGLTDPDHLLMAVLKVQGSLGTSTGHRVILPASFFASNDNRLFTEQTRKTPIDLHYPITRKDTVNLTLPPALKVESLPRDGDVSLPQCAMYSARYVQKESTLTATRTFVLGVSLYAPQEYSALRDFYGKMGSKDDEQAVLTTAPSAGGSQ